MEMGWTSVRALSVFPHYMSSYFDSQQKTDCEHQNPLQSILSMKPMEGEKDGGGRSTYLKFTAILVAVLSGVTLHYQMKTLPKVSTTISAKKGVRAAAKSSSGLQKHTNRAVHGDAVAHGEDRLVVGGGLCPEKNKNGFTNMTLEFIHIRKTGGTAIEKTAKENNILWGAVAIKKKAPTNVGGPGVSFNRSRYIHATRRRRAGNKPHIPPKFFTPNPFEKDTVATFTVIRDPYDRAVSEYYQKQKKLKAHKKGTHAANDAKYMNEYLQQSIKDPRPDNVIQQHHYIYDDDGNRIIDHVLEFRNLKEEFDALMECYSITNTFGSPLKLPDKQYNPRQMNTTLTREDLSDATIRAMNDWFRKDFELLGYPMIEVNETQQQK